MAVTLKRIFIIGAGIGGLCSAIALRQAGYQVVVFERAPGYANAGAGLTLWPNAIKALRKLGIQDIQNCAQIGTAEIRTDQGAVLQRTSVEKLTNQLGAPAIAIHRAELHRILLSCLPEDAVQVGKTLVGYEASSRNVLAYFSDGSVEHCSLLIGADGLKSAVRRQALPNIRPRYAGYTAWRAVVSPRGISESNVTTESWGRGARFGIVPIGNKKIYWFATANLPAGLRLSPEERKKRLLKRFHGWHEPIETLLHETPAGDILHNDIFDFEPLPRWSMGRVTLLGDAAHATTPNLGQGACQAIESSIRLARSLAEENDLPAALKRYENERRPRTTWITRQSRQLGQVGQLESPLLCTLRNLAVRLAPASVMNRTLVKAAGYEV